LGQEAAGGVHSPEKVEGAVAHQCVELGIVAGAGFQSFVKDLYTFQRAKIEDGPCQQGDDRFTSSVNSSIIL